MAYTLVLQQKKSRTFEKLFSLREVLLHVCILLARSNAGRRD